MGIMDEITRSARNFGQFSGHGATTVRVGPEDAEALAAEALAAETVEILDVRTMRNQKAPTVEILDVRTMRNQKAPTVEHIVKLMRRGEVRLAGMEVIIDDRRKPGVWFFTNG